jgi:glycosyltransferase involved in cell wall biosynthesis
MNNFIIVIGSKDNGKWVKYNISSILSQDYSHYKVVYYDDASSDNTELEYKNIVGDNQKFTYIKSDVRKLKTWFYSNLEKYITINDNDVLVFLDGDDMFYCDNVLSYLNSVYNQTQCWLTYGGMVVWEDNDNISQPYPQNSEIPNDVIKNKLYRKDTWRTSHLKSMKGAVWKKIDKNDFIHDEKYIVGPDDLAIMFAALELCPPNKVFRVTDPIYLYNHTETNNKSRARTDNLNVKIDYESIIRNRPLYSEISFISPTLVGGLGNQMFEIAVAASLAKDNNALLVVNNDEHILPNQGRNVNTYSSNVFNKIIFDSNITLKNFYTKNSCDYSPIPYQPNLKLNGHFQSFKYFDHNREYIKNLFINETVVDNLKIKYNIPHDATAIQVRRGDYHKFPDHHPMLSIEYYQEAVKRIKTSKIYIFSDDITWCKSNLQFDSPIEYIEDEDYNELYLISLCKNIIISNSSFGWWAAYLNNRVDSTIIVPSIWFGDVLIKDGFDIDSLLFKEWTRI